MSRSGYSDDCENIELYRANVERSLKGKRGQKFLRELADALDAMPLKQLIAGDLVTSDGECCAIGAVCLSRGLDASKIDYECPASVGRAMGISTAMAAEIEFENDDDFGLIEKDTNARRWTRMRKWVDAHLKTPDRTAGT